MEELDLSSYSDMGLADLLQTIAAEVRRRGEERLRWKRMQRTMGPRPEITDSMEAPDG